MKPDRLHPDSRRVLSVSEVNRRVKTLLENDSVLANLEISGEISNFKHHLASGHFYFTLKDARSVLRCVMFRRSSRSVTFEPADGMKVIAHGYIGVYDVRGEYQLYVNRMQPEGLGSLYLAFEKLKKKLQEEGLFDETRKRRIPAFPRRIGVVTSETAAALRDILNVLKRRFPNIEVLVSPCLVQGDMAPPSIAAAIRACARWGQVDTMIVSRGGGSIEELWAFNTEEVARAVAACPVPVISGVGHETDFTIIDFVSDLRASTPSAAAELAVMEKWKLHQSVSSLKQRTVSGIYSLLQRARQRVREKDLANLKRRMSRTLDGLRSRVVELESRMIRSTRTRVETQRDALVRGYGRLSSAVEERIYSSRHSLEMSVNRLTALDPGNVLKRGYAICLRYPERSVVNSVHDLAPGSEVQVQVRDGSFIGSVSRCTYPE